MINQRRKGATYGKTGRKPLSVLHTAAFDAFAEISEPQVLSVESAAYRAYKGHPQNSKSKHVPLGDAHHLIEKASPTKTPLQIRRDKTTHKANPSESHSNDATPKQRDVYEFASSDEDGKVDESASEGGSTDQRKRRKITPSSPSSSEPCVYDDESLQRHIATEMSPQPESEYERVSHALYNTGNNSTTSAGKSAQISKNLPANERMKTKSSPPPTRPQIEKEKISKSTSKRNQASRQVGKRPASQTRAKSPAPKRPSDQKLAKRRQHEESRHRTSLTPPTTDAESAILHLRNEVPRTTPNKDSSPAATATTPKQRELWNKLIPDEAVGSSPSQLRVSKLHLFEQDHGLGMPHLDSNSAGKPLSTALGKSSNRPVKLVESLSSRYRGAAGAIANHVDDTDGPDEGKGYEDIISQSSLTETGQALNSQGLPQVPQPGAPSQGGPSRKTYGRQRTYLSDNIVGKPDGIGISSHDPTFAIPDQMTSAPSITVPNVKDPYDAEFMVEEMPDSQGGTMRSIHELREAGGNRRLLQDLESSLDDLHDQDLSSTTIRRSGLLSLANKLMDRSTCRLFVDHSLDSRFMSQVDISEDPIMNSLVLCVLLLIISTGSFGSLLLSKQGIQVKAFLVSLLVDTRNLIEVSKLREHKMSKLMQKEYQALCNGIQTASLWRCQKPSALNNQILALQCMEYLVRQAREAGHMDKLLSSDAIQKVVAQSIPDLTSTVGGEAIGLTGCELAISILESGTLSGTAELAESEWSDYTHKRVRTLLPHLLTKRRGGSVIARLQNLTLRLYVNLTNSNVALCELYATPDTTHALLQCVVNSFQDTSGLINDGNTSNSRDGLLLTLGCLINFADSSRAMRRLVLNPGQHHIRFLDDLLELFWKQRLRAAEASRDEDADFVVSYGYLSVLLSYLCMDENVQSEIQTRLDALGGRFEDLFTSVEKFLRYHKQIDEALNSESRSKERESNFVTRSQDIIDKLRARV